MSASRRFVSLGSAVALSFWSVAGMSPASAADDDAAQILKAMSDYLSSQKTISATFDSSLAAEPSSNRQSTRTSYTYCGMEASDLPLVFVAA